jgi:hypothetical protein
VVEPEQPDQRGRRGPVVIGGIAAFLALFALTAVFATRTIERDLTRDTERALSAALPASSYDVSFDGRDARLVADSVADLEGIDAARRIVLGVHGVRTVEIDERAPAAEASIKATASRDGDGVTLTGTVLSDAERQALVAAAEAAVGASAVDDRLRVEEGGVATAATDGALTRLADVVVTFDGLTDGTATLEGTVLTISGTASTPGGADRVNAAVAAAARAGLVTQGSVVAPGAPPPAGSSDTIATVTTGAAGAPGPTAAGGTGGTGGAAPSLGGSGGSVSAVADTGGTAAGPAVGGVAVVVVRDPAGITLSGQVLSADQRDALVAAAGQAVGPGAVVDQLTVATSVPSSPIDDARVIRLAAVVATFGQLAEADAELEDARLAVSGVARDPGAADAANASVSAAQSAGLSVSGSVISVGPGELAPSPPAPATQAATGGSVVTIPTSTVAIGSAGGPGAGTPGRSGGVAAPFRSTASSATAIGS